MLSHPQAGDSDKMNEWVRLTSTDGYEFLVKRKVAACSGTLRNSLSAESQSSTISGTCMTYKHDTNIIIGSFSEALSNTAHTNER